MAAETRNTFEPVVRGTRYSSIVNYDGEGGGGGGGGANKATFKNLKKSY